MKIETTRFGTMDIEEEKVIHMPYGMMGFPEKKNFIIIRHRANSPLLWYQSLEDPALAFVITNPFLFKPGYRVDLKDIIRQMSWNGNGDDGSLELFVVVSIPKGAPHKMTGNFIGPILINNKNCQAVQIVVSDTEYTHKCPLLREEKTGSPPNRQA